MKFKDEEDFKIYENELLGKKKRGRPRKKEPSMSARRARALRARRAVLFKEWLPKPKINSNKEALF